MYVFTIIDNRWICRFHRPLHAAGHFLNPELYYSNLEMEYDFGSYKWIVCLH